MARKKQQFSTHFEHLTVEVLHVASGTPVFLMEGPGGAIVEKACSRFLVAEMS